MDVGQANGSPRVEVHVHVEPREIFEDEEDIEPSQKRKELLNVVGGHSDGRSTSWQSKSGGDID